MDQLLSAEDLDRSILMFYCYCYYSDCYFATHFMHGSI